MMIIRRTYATVKLPGLLSSQNEQLNAISVGKFLQKTRKSCPRRNYILGENFYRFATRSNIYVAASLQERQDTCALQQKYLAAVEKLDSKDTKTGETEHIHLPSTGQLLADNVNRSFTKWKLNAYDEVRNLYRSEDIHDDFIVEVVRGINFSLIGWYLQTYGMKNALAFIQWLGVPTFSNVDYSLCQLESPLLAENNSETQNKLNHMLDGYDAFEKKLNYTFQNRAFLLQSVTHETFTTNDITPDYRGLDFAGDAILNYIIVRHLFRQPQCAHSDDLLNVSSLLYSNSSLAIAFIRNEFHKYLRYTAPDIRNNIASFVAFSRRNQFKPVNDLHFLDRNNFIFEVPPIIPSSFEALIAAIFYDSKMDLNVTSNVLLNLMNWDIQTLLQTKPQTAFSQLQELDSSAIFSDPEPIGSGQIRVTVTLPQFGHKSFSGISRDPQLAKWGAAKTAVIQLKKQNSEFSSTTRKELFQHYRELK